jgi:hypothetical protein
MPPVRRRAAKDDFEDTLPGEEPEEGDDKEEEEVPWRAVVQ